MSDSDARPDCASPMTSAALGREWFRAQRLGGLGALAAGVAHDLNNILSPILMSAGPLREAGLSAEHQALVTTIEACARRGAAIVRQLQTVARGESGVRVALSLRHLMREVEHLVRATFSRDVRVVVERGREVWPVLGDVNEIHQALINLCLNAQDSMPAGGTLTLNARNVRVDAAYAAMVPGATEGRYVCLSVADTGAGIPEGDLERLFNPRLRTIEEGQASGMGLPAVLGIARAHGGFLRVQSVPGRGTEVELYFPAAPESESAEGVMPGDAAVRGRGECILVVDDEPEVRESLRRTLEWYGYRVHVAGHGAEGMALFALHQSEIRLILTDMMMPVMNGPALVQAVRSINTRVPIVGMTGLADPKRVKGLERVALTAMLEKPFSADRLLKTLEVALPSRDDFAPQRDSG